MSFLSAYDVSAVQFFPQAVSADWLILTLEATGASKECFSYKIIDAELTTSLLDLGHQQI